MQKKLKCSWIPSRSSHRNWHTLVWYECYKMDCLYILHAARGNYRKEMINERLQMWQIRDRTRHSPKKNWPVAWLDTVVQILATVAPPQCWHRPCKESVKHASKESIPSLFSFPFLQSILWIIRWGRVWTVDLYIYISIYIYIYIHIISFEDWNLQYVHTKHEYATGTSPRTNSCSGLVSANGFSSCKSVDMGHRDGNPGGLRNTYARHWGILSSWFTNKCPACLSQGASSGEALPRSICTGIGHKLSCTKKTRTKIYTYTKI